MCATGGYCYEELELQLELIFVILKSCAIWIQTSKQGKGLLVAMDFLGALLWFTVVGQVASREKPLLIYVLFILSIKIFRNYGLDI